METNETLKIALVQRAEEEIEKMVEQVQTLKEGDLKELEQVILRSSLSIGKGMIEQVLTHAQNEQKQPTRRQGRCGHRQRLVANRSKQVLTMFGRIRLERQYYQCLLTSEEKNAGACPHGEAPFDEQWGLSSGRTSPGVQKLISFLGACMTLSEATQVFTCLLPLDISERQALNLLQPVGEALQRQEDEHMQQTFEQARTKDTRREEHSDRKPEPIRRLYIELDGVLARLRRGCVPLEEHESKRQGDVYREVKVGAVFEASPGRERSHLVKDVFLDEPGPIMYVARRTSAQDFGPLLYQLAQKSGLQRCEQVIVLGDGAAWIRRIVTEQFPQAIHIVDLYHAREHVWKVANAVYGRSTSQGAAWAHAVCDLLCEGLIEEVAKRIEALPAIAPEPGAARSVPQIEADYFLTNAERMRYPRFRAQGMHIGSGIAEAACKTVVSTRAKRSGMRWTPAGLDAVLALRTAVLNRSYEDFWQSRGHRCA
jgi:Uncharacterised protein family (UPF0236)